MTGRPNDYSAIPAPGPWTNSALCKGRGDEFFGHYGAGVPLRLWELCEMCPVHKECLSYALAHHPQGIWAGTSETQRQAMRGRRNNRAVMSA